MSAKSKAGFRDLQDFFKKTGTTQEDLALRLGVTPSYVSMIANRHRQPSLRTALRIVKIARVPLETLVASADAAVAS